MKALPPSTLTVRNVEEISNGSVLIEIVMHFTPDPSDPGGDLRVPTSDVIKTAGGKMRSLHARFDRTAVDQYLAAGRA